MIFEKLILETQEKLNTTWHNMKSTQKNAEFAIYG